MQRAKARARARPGPSHFPGLFRGSKLEVFDRAKARARPEPDTKARELSTSFEIFSDQQKLLFGFGETETETEILY